MMTTVRLPQSRELAETALNGEPQRSKQSIALEKAERELTDLVRPLCSVFNRKTRKHEFNDDLIAKCLPGTFEVIQMIRAALADTHPERNGK